MLAFRVHRIRNIVINFDVDRLSKVVSIAVQPFRLPKLSLLKLFTLPSLYFFCNIVEYHWEAYYIFGAA